MTRAKLPKKFAARDNIRTNKGLYGRNSRVATYPVEVDDDGNIVVKL